ncbi:hypothetical protein GCM10010862_47500 [Devosia nitrariae]|uniref:Uncharacterized protein n=1 Tax=Devosia nitrariae TaxID=2071872 RepID=A0ABQ5WCH1_9HYPH|nr:hypothetical protein GCM10010862_47500 [Devosia nitrariae]
MAEAGAVEGKRIAKQTKKAASARANWARKGDCAWEATRYSNSLLPDDDCVRTQLEMCGAGDKPPRPQLRPQQA